MLRMQRMLRMLCMLRMLRMLRMPRMLITGSSLHDLVVMITGSSLHDLVVMITGSSLREDDHMFIWSYVYMIISLYDISPFGFLSDSYWVIYRIPLGFLLDSYRIPINIVAKPSFEGVVHFQAQLRGRRMTFVFLT